jgi:hypothetical protein
MLFIAILKKDYVSAEAALKTNLSYTVWMEVMLTFSTGNSITARTKVFFNEVNYA